MTNILKNRHIPAIYYKSSSYLRYSSIYPVIIRQYSNNKKNHIVCVRIKNIYTEVITKHGINIQDKVQKYRLGRNLM